MIKKCNLARLLLLIIISSFTVNLLIISPTLNVNAAPIDESPTSTSNIPTDIPGKATQWVYYRALSACLIHTYYDEPIEISTMSDGGIFNRRSDIKPAMGLYFFDIDNETYKCDSTGWVKNAFDNLGFGDMNEAAIAIGLSKVESTSGVKYWQLPDGHDTWGGTLIDNFRNAVFARVGDPESRFDAAVQYYQELRAFSAGCLEKTSLSYLKTDALTEAELETVPFNERYTLKYVDAEGNIQEGVYRGKGHGTNVLYRINVGEKEANNGKAECYNDGGWTETLGSLKDSVNDRVDEYAAAFQQSLIDGEEPIALGDEPTESPDSAGGSTCNIPGLGWILCPLLNIMGSIADSAYDFISVNLLEIKAEIFNTGSGNESTKGAWSIMRNVANVAFVIAFLVIIFSQLTGAGVTNYGVKKLLPRIVIAAILVNLSYYICQIAVDISNIIGRSLGTMFNSINVGSPQTGVLTGGNVWMNIVGGVIGAAAGAALIYANLAALLPLLISAVVALVMILFILGARQAIIILLIVISPLAFVAYLLPNTEGWYKKWQKTFLAMLMLYPIIGLVFGVSKFASTILTTVAGTDFFLSIVAAGVGVLPLFLIPSLLKKSLDSVGNIGATLNNLGGKFGGWAGRKVMDDTIAGQAIKDKDRRAILRRAQTQSGTYTGNNPLRRGWSAMHRSINRANWSGEFGNRRSAQGFALADAADDEALKNAGSLLNNLRIDDGSGERAISNAEKINLALGQDIVDGSGRVIVRASDTTMRRAAIQQAAPVASVDEAHRLVGASSGMSAAERKTLVSSLATSSAVKKAPWLGGRTFADIEAGNASVDRAISSAINSGGVTAEALVGADEQALLHLNNHVLATAANSPERQVIRDAIADIDNNPLLAGRVARGTDQERAIQALRSV